MPLVSRPLQFNSDGRCTPAHLIVVRRPNFCVLARTVFLSDRIHGDLNPSQHDLHSTSLSIHATATAQSRWLLVAEALCKLRKTGHLCGHQRLALAGIYEGLGAFRGGLGSRVYRVLGSGLLHPHLELCVEFRCSIYSRGAT